MVHIKTTKGLNIPIEGQPTGSVKPLYADGHFVATHLIGLDLTSFYDVKFKLLTEVGDLVKIGQPLLENKSIPGLMFVSPAGGVVKEIRRGLKRSLQSIVIEVKSPEEYEQTGPLSAQSASREQIIEKLKMAGLFAQIRKRPFNVLANPNQVPRSIFIKAIESAPFAPKAELHVEGHEKAFQEGLNALSKLTDGAVHLIIDSKSNMKAFTEAQNVQIHTAEGPYPISNASLHIHVIDPIKSPEDIVWTLDAYDVVSIGMLLNTGKYFNERIISIAGSPVIPEKRGFFKVRAGQTVEDLIAGRIPQGTFRFISGDVLTGEKVASNDFLGFYHHELCIIPENTERQFLSFFRIGADKYTASGAYLAGHFDNKDREYEFTTSQHGEKRAFITSSPYEKVMPMRIPTMELVKSVMAEDYELAESLGLLEVDSEDFALPSFVDPSKIDMIEIIKFGLKEYSKEVLI
jgi:Na+-transporting NADH:ubiquinone oxidoreductase subunit A